MRVYGFEITEEHEAAVALRMILPFTMRDITETLVEAGVPDLQAVGLGSFVGDPVAMRAADRILQRERKAGRIEPDPDNKPYWKWRAP